ncbi:MAG: serine hydroxymethyltransferase [Candidatus Nitrosocaldus sp.]
MVESDGNDEEGEAYKHYSNVLRLLREHHSWFNRCIPLIASENVPSPAVREAIVSDFANRYAEGWPGERVYAGCIYIDQVELICIELAKKVFKAEFADVRPVSGVVANLAVYAAFTEPSDTMLALAIPNGGHISHGKREHSGTAGLVRGLQVETFAFNKEEMNIDVDATIKKVEEMKRSNGKVPRLAMFGASLFLFPHPVKEVADYLHANNITICYDAAHVAGLIAGNEFQDPLREGADVMTMSTHKTLFGPQGGMILSFEKHAESIKKAVFPGNTSSHHLHNVAGKAIALAEMLEFGKDYARQVVRNARALAEALHNLGFDVLGAKHGFTRSHQVAVDVSKYGDGGSIEQMLERAGIICNRQLLPGDIKAGRNYKHPGGIRLGTSEVTRLGMREQEMVEIARFIKRVVVDREEVSKVAYDVMEFRKGFQKVHYAFDDSVGAYEYISLVKER